MAHFAQLDENNVVINVVKVADHVLLDENGNENEELGINYLKGIMGGYKWVQTSYNNRIRKTYASIGGTYNEQHDVFLFKKMYDSWVFDENELDWVSPVPKPDSIPGYILKWDEENIQWKYEEYVEEIPPAPIPDPTPEPTPDPTPAP